MNDYAAIVYSDGAREKNATRRFYRAAEDALRRADQTLHRKTPRSSNYVEAKRAHPSAHRRVANIRENHARQLASKLSRENQAVAVEKLNIASMIRTGSSRRKSIHDAGWGQSLGYLEEACTRKGVDLIKAPRYLRCAQSAA